MKAFTALGLAAVAAANYAEYPTANNSPAAAAYPTAAEYPTAAPSPSTVEGTVPAAAEYPTAQPETSSTVEASSSTAPVAVPSSSSSEAPVYSSSSVAPISSSSSAPAVGYPTAPAPAPTSEAPAPSVPAPAPAPTETDCGECETLTSTILSVYTKCPESSAPAPTPYIPTVNHPMTVPVAGGLGGGPGGAGFFYGNAGVSAATNFLPPTNSTMSTAPVSAYPTPSGYPTKKPQGPSSAVPSYPAASSPIPQAGAAANGLSFLAVAGAVAAYML